MRAIPLYRDVDISIRLSGEAILADLETRTREALGRYCDARIEANADEIAAIRKEGRRDFIKRIFIVLFLVVLILLLASVFRLEGIMLTAVVAWTGIAAWAILWNPVDTYIWGWRPNRREIRLCEKLKEAGLSIQP